MRLAVIAPVGIVLAILAGGQFLLPGVAERKIADQLTARGGEAEVTVTAFPALRLLLEDGSRLEIEAREVDLDIDQGAEDVQRLDGFDRVAISIADSTAGPFALDSLELTRDDPEPYRLRARGRSSPADVVGYGAGRLGIPGGGILGGLAGEALGDAPVPFNLDMRLASNDGRIDVVSGDSTVAGIPAGPLAELIVAAIVAQL